MKTPIALLLSSVLMAGCLPEKGDGHAVSEALPMAEDIKVNLPEDNGRQLLSLGQIADYYVFTRQITRTFNGGAAFVLIIVHTVVQYPPTSVDGDTYVWGPHSDALDPAEWRLSVTDNADGTYEWLMEGRSKTEDNAQFMTLADGHAVAGTAPHRGSGSFTLNLDNARMVDPIDNADDHGVVTVTYDLENRDGTAATLEMDIEDVDQNTGAPVFAKYAYAEQADGSGDFSFELEADTDDEGELAESMIIRSRWNADGSGRGDARVESGDLGELSVEASECWDTQFRRVYYSDSEEWLPTEGEVIDCAFADQDLPDA